MLTNVNDCRSLCLFRTVIADRESFDPATVFLLPRLANGIGLTGGSLRCGVVNGEVDVLLHSDANLDVDVETFNGDIDNCFGEKSERKSEYGPGRFLRFSRGDADRTVRIRAFNGDVDICSRNTSD